MQPFDLLYKMVVEAFIYNTYNDESIKLTSVDGTLQQLGNLVD